jgi:thiol-disulfide isomerase/thioredoxin
MDSKTKTGIIVISIIVIIIGALIGWTIWQENQPGKLDGFAQCLKDKGAIFYGAFWCPHCQNQKNLFGNSKKNLPYHECSTQDSNGELQECKDAGIKTYPTWVFADKSVQEGEMSLQALADKSGCKLPN